MLTFTEQVIRVVKSIPKGHVMSYGEVATLSGNSKASRAVGTIMAKNSDISVPCHRVVRADGTVGMYNGLRGIRKAELLKQEGVTFTNDKVCFINTQ